MKSFIEADRAGNTDGAFSVGEMYEYGNGVKKDLVSAVKWYIKAANAGNEQAKEKLQYEPLRSIAEAVSVQDQATHVPVISGDVEGVRGPTYPWYLDEFPLIDAKTITIWYEIEEILGGYPYGNMYLYVRDPRGEWHHTALFKLDKTMGAGMPRVFHLTLDKPETITAFAICPADKGMDYTTRINVLFFASQDDIGEYSSKVPRPRFTPAKTENPISFTHFATQAYAPAGIGNLFSGWIEVPHDYGGDNYGGDNYGGGKDFIGMKPVG